MEQEALHSKDTEQLLAATLEQGAALRDLVVTLEAQVEKHGAGGMDVAAFVRARQQLMTITAGLNLAFVGMECDLLKKGDKAEH
jgi:hypothetical protein